MKAPASYSPDFFSPQVIRARRFYLDLKPPRGTKLAVVSGGIEHCAPDYKIQRSTFSFHAIEYVIHGSGRLKLGGKHFELHPGTAFSYAPGVAQHLVTDAKKPLVKYFIDFTGSQSDQWLKRCSLAPGSVSQVFPPSEIQPLFDELIRSGERATRHAPELCLRLLECLGMKLLEARAPLKGADSLAFATYQDCRQFIQEHSARLRTLTQVARECHLDIAYLCRLFRRFDHQSPYQFLTRLKMSAAASQLQQPGALVKNVAADNGFTNPFHFSRAFKSVFGIAPEAFRKLR